MRKIMSVLFVAALLLLVAACLAEEPVIIPIISMTVSAMDDPTPSPTPEATSTPMAVVTPTPMPEVTPTPSPVPAMGTLMSDSQPTTLAVGGIFSGGSTVLGSDIPRASITSVRFEPSLFGAALDAWDVSEEQNGSVLAWVTDGALTIASLGGVRANADSSYLFAGYSSAASIDFGGCFYTEDAANMSHMFESCASLTALDVSGLDASNVTDMSYMFSACTELTELNLSGFDTSRAANMDGMFFMDIKLASLDLTGFQTASTASMRSMFESCTSLKALDLTAFNTSSAEDMRWMFSGCAALEEISVASGFGTGKNTSDMFSGCPALLNIVGGESNAGNAISAAEWTEYDAYASLQKWSRGDIVKNLQTRLKELGYDPGYIDGVYGPGTQKALSAWQKDHGFAASGFLDAGQALELFK